VKDHLHRRGPLLAGAIHALVADRDVALTFDDGPDPRSTPALLDELAALGAPATFFCLGSAAERHPELVRRMVAEGHAVGSHSYSHPDPWTLTYRSLVEDYRRGRSAVEQAAGAAVPLFRPPKGHIGFWEAAAQRRLGLRPWLWTIDAGDWRPGHRESTILAAVEGVVGGDVVLLHDAITDPLDPSTVDRSRTVNALGPVVELVGNRHLRLVTLPEATSGTR
jgi:peptidoglycan-N-acetylglucosamine deacetylase